MKHNLLFRPARKADILTIVEMVWNDKLRKSDRQHPSSNIESYDEYFDLISSDNNQYVLVVENELGRIVGTCHLTLLHYLPFLDRRVLVEYVRVDPAFKGQGIGRQMFEWIESKARSWQARMIQLTTDGRRMDALEFYKTLGYKPTHVGMKLLLNEV